MNTTEQLAVITKKAWFTKNIGLATRTSRLAADCDSGWRIMAEDEDEKCFDRLEQLELVPLEKICQLASVCRDYGTGRRTGILSGEWTISAG